MLKNKKNIKFIIVTFLLAILCSFLIEIIVWNKSLLTKNKTYNAKIVELHDIEKKEGWYKTTTDEAYIILEIQDGYIDKLQFKYKAEKNFDWIMYYKNNNNETQKIIQKSSILINEATRKLNTKIKTLKIEFKSSDIKIQNIRIKNSITLNSSRLLFMVILITTLIILIKFRDYFRKNLEKTFLVIAGTTGLLLIIVSPKMVYTAWDDQIHLKRAYTLFSTKESNFSQALQILESKIEVSSDNFQTREEQQTFYKELNKIHRQTRDYKIQINNYSPKYNQIVYLPFFIGFRIADILDLNFTTGFILAKLFNLICYIIIMYYAIKIATSLKKIIFVIALLVSNLFLATQFSYDPTITASLILALSLFIKMLEQKEINNKYLIAFILAVIWASLPKAVYCPVLLLALFIPNNKFKTKKQALIIKGLILLITLLLVSTFILPFFLGSVGGDSRGGNTNASAQLSLILHNPFRYCKTLIKFFIIYGPEQFFGKNTLVGVAYLYPYIEMGIDFIYIGSFIFLMYASFTSKMDKEILTNKIKFILFIMLVGIWLLVVTAMYLSFTEVGLNTINGVQSRYFIFALLPILLILLPTTNKNKEKEKNPLPLIFISFLILMFVILLFIFKGKGI